MQRIIFQNIYYKHNLTKRILWYFTYNTQCSVWPIVELELIFFNKYYTEVWRTQIRIKDYLYNFKKGLEELKGLSMEKEWKGTEGTYSPTPWDQLGLCRVLMTNKEVVWVFLSAFKKTLVLNKVSLNKSLVTISYVLFCLPNNAFIPWNWQGSNRNLSPAFKFPFVFLFFQTFFSL